MLLKCRTYVPSGSTLNQFDVSLMTLPAGAWIRHVQSMLLSYLLRAGGWLWIMPLSMVRYPCPPQPLEFPESTRNYYTFRSTWIYTKYQRILFHLNPRHLRHIETWSNLYRNKRQLEGKMDLFAATPKILGKPRSSQMYTLMCDRLKTSCVYTSACHFSQNLSKIKPPGTPTICIKI